MAGVLLDGIKCIAKDNECNGICFGRVEQSESALIVCGNALNEATTNNHHRDVDQEMSDVLTRSQTLMQILNILNVVAIVAMLAIMLNLCE